MESAEGASAPRRYGDELGDRLAIAGDYDFFAALDFGEQAREVGLLLADVDDD